MLLLAIISMLAIQDFERPLTAFGPGHRGVDMVLNEVFSPISGTVSFAGKVFNRYLITVESPEGKFSFEPVCSELDSGDGVSKGQMIGIRCQSEDYKAHCLDCVHISFRDPDYRNPLWVMGLREPSRVVSGPGMGLRVSLSKPFD